MKPVEVRVQPGDWSTVLGETDGYQLVVAGPGTGKTEFLVRRVALLLSEQRALPEQIAVLSFSRRSAADMRDRIGRATKGVAGALQVSTFHSLALRLLEASHPASPPLPLTTPEQVSLISDLLVGEEPGAWAPRYRPILTSDAFAGEVADFLMRCSERLLEPGDLKRMVAEQPNWRGLPEFFSKYLDHATESGRTDYATLIRSALDELRSPEHAWLHNFRYVLVDEYQDTTPAHAAMAEELASIEGNLTVAGDPYQSIYSFRGADLRNVSDFAKKHDQATRIVLDQSFRVPDEIMSSALRVVSEGSLPGAAGRVTPASHQGSVAAYVFDQESTEADWIASRIERLMTVDGLAATDIAVLVRSKQHFLKELSRALDRRAIPHDSPEGRLVDHPAIRAISDLSHISKYDGSLPTLTPPLTNSIDTAMKRLLLGPMFNVSLGLQRDLLRERRREWEPWHQILGRRPGKLSALGQLLADQTWSGGIPAAEGFWELWTGFEPLNEAALDPARPSWRLALTAFSQAVNRQFERDPEVSLYEYLELTEDERFEATPLLSFEPSQSRVTLTTLHQAKGLQFEVVFVANAVEGVFPDLKRSRRLLRPEYLSPDLAASAGNQHLFQVQEEMRLAYTAMTRARKQVIWTATSAGQDQGERRPSRFLKPVAGVDSLDAISSPPQETLDPTSLIEAEIQMRRVLLDPSAEHHRRLAAAVVLASAKITNEHLPHFPGVPAPGPNQPILESTVRISPSQAGSYEICPRRYALERRLRLGDASSPYAMAGSLIHKVLELAESEILDTGARHARLDRVLELVDEVWESVSFGTPELTGAWKHRAIELLTRLYEKWPGEGVPIRLEARVEMDVSGIKWLGVVDRIELTDQGAVVVDYKTGSGVPTLEETKNSLQLAFYAAAVQRQLGEPVTAAEFWYPGKDSVKLTVRRLEQSNTESIQRRMEDLTTKIVAEDWTPNVGDHCSRCNYRLSCPAWPEGRGAYLP